MQHDASRKKTAFPKGRFFSVVYLYKPHDLFVFSGIFRIFANTKCNNQKKWGKRKKANCHAASPGASLAS
jgi:hypothetical protein